MARISMTPEEFADKHARRLKAAIPDIQAGINRVTESPTIKAANKKDKMKARLNESIDNGKWEAGLRRVTLESWKSAIINKGLQRISGGIDGAKDKVVAFGTQLLAYETTLQNQVNQMPDLTLEDSLARSQAWIRGMAKFQRK